MPDITRVLIVDDSAYVRKVIRQMLSRSPFLEVVGAARSRPVPARVLPAASPRPSSGQIDIVVIGISTGGPQALKALIPRLPAELSAPIAIVLHMPVGYTELYARKLNEQSALVVLESQGGELVTKGNVYLSPAGRHLTLRRIADGGIVTNLDVRPV